MTGARATELRLALRGLLSAQTLHVVPGVTNVLDARAAARHGFPAVFLTGAGIANTMFGWPDIGLVTMTETVDVTRRIANGVDVPVITDADTGYGNHLNVFRTVTELESAGAAAIIIEDQLAPKRCGHFEGKRVVSELEMVEKLLAARRARADDALVLVARTDAIATEGIEGALHRAKAYVAAGADVIFVEAPTTEEELASIPRAVGVPCLVNCVEGGATPVLSAAEYEGLGFRLALYANLALRVAGYAVDAAFASLKATGKSDASIPHMLTWEERQNAVGLPRWQELDIEIAREARNLHGRGSSAS